MSRTVPKARAESHYNLTEITQIAEQHFPSEFESLIDVDEIQWHDEKYEMATFAPKSIFLGFTKRDGSVVKVSAYITTKGVVELYAKAHKLQRDDYGRIRLQEPWVHASEGDRRSKLRKIKALCAWYFLAAGLVDEIYIEKDNWFKTFKQACKRVGEGMETVEED